MAVIGLDLGTTGCKAVVFDRQGGPLATAYREYPIHQPHPGWAEQDAGEVWARVLETLAEAVAGYTGSDPVRAIGLSVQGEAVVPLDAAGEPLAPVMLGMDTRTVAECRRVAESFGADALYAATGMPNHTINTLPKLMWLQAHRPDVCRQARRYVLYEDLLLLRLGGRPAISRCLASRTALYDLHARDWSPRLLALAGVSPEQLSPLAASGAAVGTLDPAVARRVGLSPDVLLVAGGHDQACGALGAGVTAPGQAMVSTGTAEVMEVALASPAPDPALARGGISVYEHVVPEMYVAMTLNHGGGIVLRWCRDVMFPEAAAAARARDEDPYAALLEGAPDGPSPVLCLPHLAGAGTPILDPASQGAFTGLTLSTTRTQLVKSILDALTYELRANLELLTAAGVRVAELIAIGGGARSPVWLKTKADILGCRVRVPRVTEAACLGAALLAAVAAGEQPDLAAAVAAAVQTKEVFEPNPALEAQYDRAYSSYRRLYPTLKPLHNPPEEGDTDA